MKFEVVDFANIIDYAHASLAACGTEDEFNSLAREIAEDEGLDLALIRAIGRGALSEDFEASRPFIVRYLNQARDDNLLRAKRRAVLASLFGSSEAEAVPPALHEAPQASNPDEPGATATNNASRTPPVKCEEDVAEPGEKAKKSSKTELTDEDKEFIREYVAAGIDEEDKKARRREVFELFKGVTLAQIAAITAWTKIRAQKATKEEPESLGLGPDEIEFIQDFVLEANTPEDESERCVEMAEMFGIDVSQIESLVLEALITDYTSQEASDTEVVPTVLKSGAHVEYDNPEKNKWREKMKEFILECTTEVERARMKVLCLPGKKWLEATQVYLELGFKPENIHGVEREKTARDEFKTTAEELGCQAHFGDLMRYVQHPDTPAFDIISLDFLGPFSEGTICLLERLKPTRRQLLLTNFMGKREGSGQVIMRMAKELSDTSDWRSAEGVNDDARALDEKIRTGENSEIPVGETRNFIWRFLSRYLAARHVNPYYDKRLRKLGISFGCDAAETLVWAVDAVMPIISSIENGLKTAGEHEKIVGVIGSCLRGLFAKTLIQEATIKSAELYEYRSGSGSSTSNYISDFIELETPIEELNSMRHSAKFLFDSVEAIRLEMNKDPAFSKSDATVGVYPDKTIRCLVKGKTIASIKINRVKQDVDIYLSICRQNLWDRILSEESKMPTRERI